MNILSVRKGIIVHQVNCKGVMGCGLALQIKRKWPIVFERYRAFKFKPGQIQLVNVADDFWVCNLAGQDRYGRDKRYTDYEAIRIGLEKLNIWAGDRGLSVFIPNGMGCGNAGGDWHVVQGIIICTLTDCDFFIQE